MSLDIVPLSPLERGELHVMRVRAAITALVLIAMAVGGELLLYTMLDPGSGYWRGSLLVPALLLPVWTVGIAPARRWRHWGYAFTGRELHVSHGWLFQSHVIVPVSRVQHIDVTQGPIERAFGVTTLVLHTAGTDHSLVALPGITRATAEDIRDSIRATIGSAP